MLMWQDGNGEEYFGGLRRTGLYTTMEPRQLDAAAAVALVQGRDDFAVLPKLWKVGSTQVRTHIKVRYLSHFEF